MRCIETRKLIHDGWEYMVCYVDRNHEEICKHYDIVVDTIDKFIVICR